MDLSKATTAADELYYAAKNIEEREAGPSLLEVVDQLTTEATTEGSRWQLLEERKVLADPTVSDLRDALATIIAASNLDMRHLTREDIHGAVQSGILLGAQRWVLAAKLDGKQLARWGSKLWDSASRESGNRTLTNPTGSVFSTFSFRIVGLQSVGPKQIAGAGSGVSWNKNFEKQEQEIRTSVASLLGVKVTDTQISVTWKQPWGSAGVSQERVSDTATAVVSVAFHKESDAYQQARAIFEGYPILPMKARLSAIIPAPSDTDLAKTNQTHTGRVIEWLSESARAFIEKGAGPPESLLYPAAKATLQVIVTNLVSIELEKAGVGKMGLPIDPVFETEGVIKGLGSASRGSGSLPLGDGRSGMEFRNDSDVATAINKAPVIYLPKGLLMAQIFQELRNGREGVGMQIVDAKGDELVPIWWPSRQKERQGAGGARLEGEAVQVAAKKQLWVYIPVDSSSGFARQAQEGTAGMARDPRRARIERQSLDMIGRDGSYIPSLLEKRDGRVLSASVEVTVSGSGNENTSIVIRLLFKFASDAMATVMALEAGEESIDGIEAWNYSSATFGSPFNLRENAEALQDHVKGLKYMTVEDASELIQEEKGPSIPKREQERDLILVEVTVVIPKDAEIIATAKTIVITKEQDGGPTSRKIMGVDRIRQTRKSICATLKQMLQDPQRFTGVLPQDLPRIVEVRSQTVEGYRDVVKAECPVKLVITVERDLAKSLTDAMAKAGRWGPPDVWTQAEVFDVAAAKAGVKDNAATDKKDKNTDHAAATAVAGYGRAQGRGCNYGDALTMSDSPTKGAASQLQRMSMGDIPKATTKPHTSNISFLMPTAELFAKLNASKRENDVCKAVGELCAVAGVSMQPGDEAKWTTVRHDDDLLQSVQRGIAAIKVLATMEGDVRAKAQEAAGTNCVMEVVQAAADEVLTEISAAKEKNQMEVSELMATPTDDVQGKIGPAMIQIQLQCKAGAEEAKTFMSILETEEWQLLWTRYAMRAMPGLGGDDVAQEGREGIEAAITERIDMLASELASSDKISLATEGIVTWTKEMSSSSDIQGVWDEARASRQYDDAIYVASASLEYAVEKILQLVRQEPEDHYRESDLGPKTEEAGGDGETRKRVAEDEDVGDAGEPRSDSDQSPAKKTRVKATANEPGLAVAEAVSQRTRSSRSVTPAPAGEFRPGNDVSPLPTLGEEGSK